MRSVLRSGFFWQFVAGFALGAVGVVGMHPSVIAHTIDHHLTANVSQG